MSHTVVSCNRAIGFERGQHTAAVRTAQKNSAGIGLEVDSLEAHSCRTWWNDEGEKRCRVMQ